MGQKVSPHGLRVGVIKAVSYTHLALGTGGETVQPEKDDESAATGDGSNMVLWAVLLLAAGTTGTVVYNRRKNA